MFTTAHKHRWLPALASPFVAAALLGTPNAEAPTVPEPHAIAAQRSQTGKIIDRLPGSSSTTPHFETTTARSDWALAAVPSGIVAFASETEKDTSATAAVTVDKPVLVAAVASTRPHRARIAVATLPPRRPAALAAPQSTIQIASVQQKRPSVTSRMIAFVGSLAGLANLL